MSDREMIRESLRALPHFRMARSESVERVAEGCRTVTYGKGDQIFRAGEPCRGFFVIHRGSVCLYRLAADGRQHVLHSLYQGQSFAEAALLNHGRYPACAEARSAATELIEVDGAHFQKVLAEDSRLAPAMVGSLCSRLLSLVDRVEELSVISAAARLARFLLRLPSSGPLEAAEVTLPMSKKDVAAHLSVTPETLSRTLRQWKERGVVEADGRRLILRDLRVLQALADGDAGPRS